MRDDFVESFGGRDVALRIASSKSFKPCVRLIAEKATSYGVPPYSQYFITHRIYFHCIPKAKRNYMMKRIWNCSRTKGIVSGRKKKLC